jgi:hypothetical protein
MNDAMRTAQTKLVKLLEADQLTAGMYVRARGDHLIAGRTDQSALIKPLSTMIVFDLHAWAPTSMASA